MSSSSHEALANPVHPDSVSIAPQNQSTLEPDSELATPLEPVGATASGRLLVPQEYILRQRELLTNMRQALRCASFIYQEFRVMVSNYKRTSKTATPFQNDIRVLGVLSDYLVSSRDLLSPLNTALNKLDFDWGNYDPRDAFFAFPDVFRYEPSEPTDDLSPEGLRAIFQDALMMIVDAAVGMGYSVKRKVYTDTKSEHPNRKWVYAIPRVTDDSFDPADSITDSFEGVGEDDALGDIDDPDQVA